MPYIVQTTVGTGSKFHISGDDYDTRDGTGELYYLHVVNLAKAHVLSLNAIASQVGHYVINIGTGHGVTVKGMVKAFEIACGHSINRRTVVRREGDLPNFFVDHKRVQTLFGWTVKLSLADMCRNTWTWQSQNPSGYMASEY